MTPPRAEQPLGAMGRPGFSARVWGWGLALLLYSALIFWLSSAPRELPGPEFPFQDKLIHLTAYGLMAALAFQWLSGLAPDSRKAPLGAALYATLYGAGDEWHQSFVPGRDASLGDWLADGLGALLAVGLLLCLRGRRPAHF